MMNSERRDRCSRVKSSVGSGIPAFSGYSFRAEVVEYYRKERVGYPISNHESIHRGRGPTYELFASALHFHVLVLLHVSRFTGLGSMEPTADTQPLAAFRTFIHYNLFHGMMTPPRLHFEEDELVPTGWYRFCRRRLWFCGTLNNWVQLQRTSVFGLPRFPVR